MRPSQGMPMGIRTQESFNFYSHLAGAVAAVAGTVYLLFIASHSASMLITALVYALSLVFLFSASSLYHAFKKQENELSFWRKMDRLAIFFMIAGTYTPISYFCLEGNTRWIMIGFQWSVVAFGFFSQLFFPRAPRVLYVLIYSVMGWSAIFPIRQVLASLTPGQQVLLFTGAAAFTAGALIYAIKKPRLVPGIFSFHELFHIMVLLGGVLHYALICRVYITSLA